jgi:3-hydroxyisobutyrate dehydrogenase-like beta-hydroxyacid dehydrogenase
MNAQHGNDEIWTFLGFGEAASALLAAGFGNGARVSVCLPAGREPSMATQQRLRTHGLTAILDPSCVSAADVVLSLVTPDAAVDVATTVAPFLRPGAFYVDLNSISGQRAADIATLVEGRGARFIDAAVMGPVPLMKLRVPIWLSGGAAKDFQMSRTLQGLNVSVISLRPGDASAIKMLWSVMTKGTIALLAESLTAAHRLGLLEPLLSLIEQEYGNTGSPAMVMRMLRSTAASGGRRLVEMQEARRTLDTVAVPAWTVDATLRWIAALNGMPGVSDGQTVPEVIGALSEALRIPLGKSSTPST